MDDLELQDQAALSLAAARQRYRAACAKALAAFADLPEIAQSIRHWAGALGDEARATSEKFLTTQDGHLFSAAYDWHLAAGEATRRATPPESKPGNSLSHHTEPKPHATHAS